MNYLSVFFSKTGQSFQIQKQPSEVLEVAEFLNEHCGSRRLFFTWMFFAFRLNWNVLNVDLIQFGTNVNVVQALLVRAGNNSVYGCPERSKQQSYGKQEIVQ